MGLNPAGSDPQVVSLCTVRIGSARYGIETSEIREVLGGVSSQPVPLAPAFVAGISSYRGDVLTVLDLGALLGFGAARAGSVLVFSNPQGELYGIGVEAIEGVAIFDPGCWQPNPSTLSPAALSLFHGSYRDAFGLVLCLRPAQFAPTRLITYPWLQRPAAHPMELE